MKMKRRIGTAIALLITSSLAVALMQSGCTTTSAKNTSTATPTWTVVIPTSTPSNTFTPTFTATLVCFNATMGTAYTTSISPFDFCGNPTNGYWMVMGLTGPTPTTNYDQLGWQSCGGTQFGPSNYAAGAVDYLLWNGNVSIPSCIKSESYLVSGSGPVWFQWQNTTNQIGAGTPTPITVGAADVVQVFDTNLASGTSYTFNFSAPANMILKIHKPDTGQYQTRGQAANFAYGGSSFSFTPTMSGWHGLVIANNPPLVGSTTVTITRTP